VGAVDGGGGRNTDAGPPSAAPPLTPHDCEMVARFVRAMQGGLHLPHLVHSLCPAIKGAPPALGCGTLRTACEAAEMTHTHGMMTGHELVKCGLVLSLLGGVRKHGGSNERIPVRGDIHLLIVGDPGLGKSQMLKAACAVAPRGIYVCGNSTSSSGLTGGHSPLGEGVVGHENRPGIPFSCAPVVERGFSRLTLATALRLCPPFPLPLPQYRL
jgi:hypothetical protein